MRNTEEADNAQHDAAGGNGRGIGKGVWGMIEDSSLARSIRLNEGKQASLFRTSPVSLRTTTNYFYYVTERSGRCCQGAAMHGAAGRSPAVRRLATGLGASR